MTGLKNQVFSEDSSDTFLARNMWERAVQDAINDMMSKVPDGMTIEKVHIKAPTQTFGMSVIIAYTQMLYPCHERISF